MKQILGDLHLHTVLSPCAAPDMTPAAVVRTAAQRGLALVAICDHNGAANTAAAQRCGAPEVAVLAGIEITTAEEVHLLGLFPNAVAAMAVAGAVRATLPPLGCAPRWMGPQRIVDEHEVERGREDRLLAAASAYSLHDAVALIHERGGLAVAAHVDRPSFGLLGQLGLLPADVRLDALEVSPAGCAAGRAAALRALGLPLLCGSDAHCLDQIGDGGTVLEVEGASFAELCRAVRGEAGRRCSCA